MTCLRMATGTVMWFREDDGCGLIAPDEGDRRYVVHWSAIVGWPKRLTEGARVEFEVRRGLRGYEAEGVKLLAAPEANLEPSRNGDEALAGELTSAPFAARSEPGEASGHQRS